MKKPFYEHHTLHAPDYLVYPNQIQINVIIIHFNDWFDKSYCLSINTMRLEKLIFFQSKKVLPTDIISNAFILNCVE